MPSRKLLSPLGALNRRLENYAVLQGEYGFYTYNRNHNSHVEIVAFDKIVVDAKQRHKALFEKLGIGG